MSAAAGVQAQTAGPVDQVDLGGGDICDRPLLSDAAVAGLLNDCLPLDERPVDGLEALAALGAHELDDGVFGVGRRRDRQTGGGCYRHSGQQGDKSVISHFNSPMVD